MKEKLEQLLQELKLERESRYVYPYDWDEGIVFGLNKAIEGIEKILEEEK